MLYYLLLLSMTFIGAFASLFLKKASSNKSFIGLLKNINLYLGAGLYLVASLINIYILKFLDYTVVLPLTAITYIWTMLISYLILREKIGYRKAIGVFFILIGAMSITF